LAPVLHRIFAMEGPLLGRVPMPLGVSLICLARKAPLPLTAMESPQPETAERSTELNWPLAVPGAR